MAYWSQCPVGVDRVGESERELTFPSVDLRAVCFVRAMSTVL